MRTDVDEIFCLGAGDSAAECISASGQVYLFNIKLILEDRYTDGDFISGNDKSRADIECCQIKEKKIIEFLPRHNRAKWPRKKGDYSQYFWRLFEKTPYNCLSKKEYLSTPSLFWRAIFKIFPKRLKLGVLARKTYKFIRAKKE